MQFSIPSEKTLKRNFVYLALDPTVGDLHFPEISNRTSIILENVGETRMTGDQPSDQRVKRSDAFHEFFLFFFFFFLRRSI